MFFKKKEYIVNGWQLVYNYETRMWEKHFIIREKMQKKVFRIFRGHPFLYVPEMLDGTLVGATNLTFRMDGKDREERVKAARNDLRDEIQDYLD